MYYNPVSKSLCTERTVYGNVVICTLGQNTIIVTGMKTVAYIHVNRLKERGGGGGGILSHVAEQIF